MLTSLLVVLMAWPVMVTGQNGAQPPTFRTGVERVTVNASVRTRRGKPVTNLKVADFELLDSGTPVAVREFRAEISPVSVAMLVDFSGSMDVASRRQAVHETAKNLLNQLTPSVDEAGLYVFDKVLRELQPVGPAPGNILSHLESAARPFGATSLFDAIAETGKRISEKGGPRRAVVALTDGADNASLLSPEEVSRIASGIDVPVYVMVIISPHDRSGSTTIDDERLMTQALTGPLANLAHWTGGDIVVAIKPDQSAKAAEQIIRELRQQYLLAFEPGTRPGWHRIELRTRDKDLIVRARSGYIITGRPEGL